MSSSCFPSPLSFRFSFPFPLPIFPPLSSTLQPPDFLLKRLPSSSTTPSSSGGGGGGIQATPPTPASEARMCNPRSDDVGVGVGVGGSHVRNLFGGVGGAPVVAAATNSPPGPGGHFSTFKGPGVGVGGGEWGGDVVRSLVGGRSSSKLPEQFGKGSVVIVCWTAWDASPASPERFPRPHLRRTAAKYPLLFFVGGSHLQSLAGKKFAGCSKFHFSNPYC